MVETNKYPFLYNFLINPKFRTWRHILLILAFATITFNQIFLIYHESIGILGNRIYWMCLCLLTLYLITAYFNIYILVPKFLLNKKYIVYITALLALIILLLILRYIYDYFISIALDLPHRVESYTNPIIIIYSLCFCAVTAICFLGTSASILLRYWMNESQRVSQLEKESVQSEVDNLKEQIAPDFLSNILNCTSVLVKSEPEKASDMLMKLSQLLRYQLYDCSRDKVLLSSAVNFLTNYLTLEQLYSSKIGYEISTTGNISRILIPPLLFVPFVRYVINKINYQPEKVVIQLYFKVYNENHVQFTCAVSDTGISLDNDFSAIRQRLNLLYTNNYTLTVSKDLIKLLLSPLKS